MATKTKKTDQKAQRETTKRLHGLLNGALSDSNGLECTRQKNGEECTRQHDDEFDEDGRPVYFYSLGCEVVESFCPSCRAYWAIAVANNAVYDAERMLAALAADAEAA